MANLRSTALSQRSWKYESPASHQHRIRQKEKQQAQPEAGNSRLFNLDANFLQERTLTVLSIC